MRHIFTISALTALLSLFSVTASAYDIAVENEGVTIYYNYSPDGTGLEVTYKDTGYNSFSGVVVIPEKVIYSEKTYSVTAIGNTAFWGCKALTSVTIPASVTSIGENAFYDCSGLKKVIIKDIAAWCNINFSNGYANPLFYAQHLYSDENTEITNLVIPNSVTSIGQMAFSGCSSLTSVTIPNSVTSIGMVRSLAAPALPPSPSPIA